MTIKNILVHNLLEWYRGNQRDLPWRNQSDAYKIWVSEIILQQTRVAQGWDYYLKFVRRFPDVRALATAREEEVLQLWQGLGYYSRARNMHTAAKQIVEHHKGIFPDDYAEILRLKGIGRYTAAAIASIAYNIAVPAVDGNVLRVVSRFLGIFDDIAAPQTYKVIENHCAKWIEDAPPGEFNQAMMELGATCCKPKNPTCHNCPLNSQCYAFVNEKTNVIPLKINKIKVKNRYFHFFIFIQNEKILLEQRTHNDIWKKLFQYPLIETKMECELPDKVMLKNLPAEKIGKIIFKQELTHQLTHQKLYIRFYQVEKFSEINSQTHFWVTLNQLSDYSLPVPLQRIWENI